MCKHCEKLVKDAPDKELVHKFMARVTEKVNRKLREQGNPRYVTANDIDLNIEVNHIPAQLWLLFRDLNEMHK